KVKDANGQSLAYVYGRETKADADIANVLTMEEARRIASASSPTRSSQYGALNHSQRGHLEHDGINRSGRADSSDINHEIDYEPHLACFIIQGGLCILNGALPFGRLALCQLPT